MIYILGKWHRTWLPEMDDALRELVAAGLSLRKAAEEINARFGSDVTRNAAIGRANRLQFKAPANPGPAPKPRKQKKLGPRPAPRPAPLSAAVVPMLCEEVAPLNLGLIELSEGTCHWPYGDGPFVFCGHAVRHGSPYCPHHAGRAVGHGTYSERRAAHGVRA